MTPIDRLRSRALIDENGCHIWQGCINSRGYGVISVGGQRQLAHRVAYVHANGPMPEGHETDHLCRVKRCVNPGHLEAVTSRENNHRKPNVHKSHCVHGHELTPENTKVKRRANGHEIRNCRECNRVQQRARYAAHHLVAPVIPLPMVERTDEQVSA